MSKKKLLNESTVRRFMKLANMQGLSENFITEMGMGDTAYQDDEDEMADMPEDEMADMPEEEPEDMGPEDMGAEELEVDDDFPEVDDDDVEESGPEDVQEIDSDEADILRQAGEILSRITSDVEGGAGMDMEPEMEMDMEEEPGGRDYMEEAAYEDELDEVELVDENKLVQEVTRRVAARLRAAVKSRK